MFDWQHALIGAAGASGVITLLLVMAALGERLERWGWSRNQALLGVFTIWVFSGFLIGGLS